MTDKLRARMVAAGHDQETIALTAANPAMCALLVAFYCLEEGGRGEEVTAVVDILSQDTDNRGKSTPASDAKRVYLAAKELFGGFTRSQVDRLLAVCRYKGILTDDLIHTMYELRAQSWARGWVRTRDAIEGRCLAA